MIICVIAIVVNITKYFSHANMFSAFLYGIYSFLRIVTFYILKEDKNINTEEESDQNLGKL
jgi:hypothetical protein